MKYLVHGLVVVSVTLAVALVGILFVAAEYKTSQDNLIKQGLFHKNYLLSQNNQFRREIQVLAEELNLTEQQQLSLREKLKDEQKRFNEVTDQIDDAIQTVEVLDKLSKTDEELLQKYSQVYFLNEHYIPQGLKVIPSQHTTLGRTMSIKSEVWPFLDELLEEAEGDGITLQIASAYRSFTYQQQIKQTYVTLYGSGANKFSADQGYSEHQLGTTVDFTAAPVAPSLSGFETTPAFAWLQDNAHKYGFVLSYPESNSYYQYEPWHWRFVGEDLARDLRRKGQFFYDWDQRDINEYLINIFD